jgi:hypothetical protein
MGEGISHWILQDTNARCNDQHLFFAMLFDKIESNLSSYRQNIPNRLHFTFNQTSVILAQQSPDKKKGSLKLPFFHNFRVNTRMLYQLHRY